ncbi:MAG: iron ABC transporter permease [Coriobacteriales bacterium]|nr:iron ABC transporter permease [Coriobacteriales bacterium]
MTQSHSYNEACKPLYLHASAENTSSTGDDTGVTLEQELSQQSTDSSLPAEVTSHRRTTIIIICLGVLCLIAAGVSLLLGRFPISPSNAIRMLINSIPFVTIDPTWTNQESALFFNVRLPRIVMAMLVGCCLSAAGAAYQGTFQNPLTSPDILGASQGAALGAAIAILLGLTSLQVSFMAFAFSIIAVLLVLVVASHAKGNRVLVVVLSGVMVSSLMSAGVSYAKLVADPTDQLPSITYWLMGSLTGVHFSDITLVLLPMSVGLVVLFALRWKINILTMGDEEAQTMGVNAKAVRIAVIIAATLVTASSVAVTGMIGWVGLVIPHLSRMLVGPDYRRLLPASMLMGAAFLLIVDDVSRLISTSEIPIGILTAFVGAPFFLYLITRRNTA